MSYSNLDFTPKFFHASQRTVPCHNGFLDTRTKNIVAKDRLIVAEQRTLDIEKRKSASNLQLITYEQKQLEKRLSSLHNLDRFSSIHHHHRSISETNVLHRTRSWNEISDVAHNTTFYDDSSQNIASLSKDNEFQRKFSRCLDEGRSEKSNPISNEENPKSIVVPILAIIPPEE